MTDTAGSPLDGLNRAQFEAVMHGEGPALVLAGAGSGKTKVLTTRIARLIEGEGVHPARILAVTFTNKAAGEMRERIARLVHPSIDLRSLWMGTFHAIGARMLRRDAERVGRTSRFTIYDEDDAIGLLKRTMESLKVSPKEWAPKAVLAQISDAKNALVSHVEYARLAQDPLARVVEKLYPAFDAALAAANAVTFDDLLVLPVKLLAEHPDVLRTYRDRFGYVLVDEYQDTNHAQFRLVSLLGGGTGNVMVVGDDDQSIYGWRGADIKNILDFERTFPGAHVVKLEENYRSTPEILALANAAIAGNTGRRGKTLRATRPSGPRPVRVRCLDERDEADFIADDIAERRGPRATGLREIAVLYRTNSQSRAFEESFRRRGWPYRLVGAVRFYDRREIRDLMAYLKLVANPSDDEAFRRAINVPKRGIGDTTVEALAEGATARGVTLLAAAGDPGVTGALRPATRAAIASFVALMAELRTMAAESSVDELLEAIITRTNYSEHLRSEGPEGLERIENVKELVTSAAEQLEDEEGEVGLTPLDRYLQRAMLVAGTDQLDPSADAITMMTLHNAKGLEYPTIYLTGMEDGLFPLARAYDDPATLEEERRLFYVGITRAERMLMITHAEQRRRNGELLPSRPSSFLDELPKELIEVAATPRAKSMGRAAFPGSSWGGSFDREERATRWKPREAIAPASIPKWTAKPVSAAPDQDVEAFTVSAGARVRHRKFGAGRIAEVMGSGRDLKVRIDFDDESVGRKTLVVAQANLEPESD
jgi:DNA helicase-2/ATP-dependent DNA helicase PcrA